jgi:adenylate cyclase
MPIDFEAEGLLEGAGDEAARRARLELLEELTAAGLPLEELKLAVAENRLALVPVERVLVGDGERRSAREIAEQAGLEYEFLTKIWRALGLAESEPDDRVYSDEDVEAGRRLARFRDAGMPEDAMLEITRVLGHGISRLAAAIRENFAQAFLRPGDTERDIGVRYAEATRELAPQLGPVLEHALRAHLREQVRQGVIEQAELETGRLAGATEITVCFADLAGFTRLGETVAPDELGAVAGRFGELAGEVASAPVRLVKMVGDGAMLVSTGSAPDAVIEAGLGLIEAVDGEGEGFPQVRVGIAAGEALSRGGDWYGRPVNLASRLSALARRGSALTTEEVKEAAKDGWSWSEAGLFRVKGVKGRVRAHRVRRPRSSER